MSNKPITVPRDQVIDRLSSQANEAGGIRAWSRANRGFSASFISDVLTDKIDPSKKLLKLLKFDGVLEPTYRQHRNRPPPRGINFAAEDGQLQVAYLLRTDATNAVKIGGTTIARLLYRVTLLQVGNHEKLLLIRLLDGDHEQSLQDKFRPLRRPRGEWFDFHPWMLAPLEIQDSPYFSVMADYIANITHHQRPRASQPAAEEG